MLSDRHYLLKVMGISAIPRLLTFALKFVSFPMMVRNLGATEFGIVVYITAVISVLESFVDFGVSSAAGKEIAVARETRTLPVSQVVRKWAKLQTAVALIGLGPLLVVSYLLASSSSQIVFSFRLLALLVLGAWITISLNFVRAALASILAFKSLGALDATESLIRSAGWLAVGYIFPTTMGFAMANLLTAVFASALGIVVLVKVIGGREDVALVTNASVPALHLRHMFRESFNFLWLRLVTRVFQSIPIMILGRMFSSELIGIVGAFARINELINFPLAVIGSALAVRAPGVLVKGTANAKVLWDAVSRFIAVSLMLAVSIYLGSEVVARILLPDSHGAAKLIAILSVTVVTTGIASVVAPMSDYVGALRSRNILLTIFALGQVPVIWLGSHLFGETGGILSYVAVLVLMNLGYVKIALTVFFPTGKYRVRSEFSYFIAITAVAVGLTMLAHRAFGFDRFSVPLANNVSLLDIGLSWIIVIGSLALYQPAKRFFITRVFFDFSDSAQAGTN